MHNAMDYPSVVFLSTLVAMSLSAWIGASVLRRVKSLTAESREDFNVVQAATLTLLALMIGFSFSMAVGRYDQRKNYEEEEANAIGTEYVRADLLPSADAQQVRALLTRYIEQRVLFYRTRDVPELQRINTTTAQLQAGLWAAVRDAAAAQPNPVTALAVAGMNDVLNSQGYTQAAWWNRIPIAAWGLMVAIAVCCNLLVGYGARTARVGLTLLVVLPVVVATSFALIADIDSPRGGIIRVSPINLVSTAQSLRPS
jgi:hypothetical protein